MNSKDLKYVNKVLNKYNNVEHTKLDELRRLDKKVESMPRNFSIIFGIIVTLLFGFGMCVAMQIILKDFIILGIILGIVGMLLMIINYPIYKKTLNNRKNKYSERIKELTKELLNE